MIQGVCDQCGGKLIPLKTVDNSGVPTYWGGCESCNKFCWGVHKKVWKISRTLVEKERWTPYSTMDRYESEKDEKLFKYYLDCQTSGAVRQVYDVLKVAGIDPNTI